MRSPPTINKPLVDGLRAVAVLEAVKGVVVLAAGLGLLGLVHRNVELLAEDLLRFSHLNPASKYPRIFLDAAAQATDARLWWLAAGAAAYALVRFVEAYGLWRGRAWAEWLALAGSGLYVPVELYHLAHGFSWLKIGVLGINLAVVAYMAFALWHRAQAERAQADKSARE